jgi:hypothetical protein
MEEAKGLEGVGDAFVNLIDEILKVAMAHPRVTAVAAVAVSVVAIRTLWTTGKKISAGRAIDKEMKPMLKTRKERSDKIANIYRPSSDPQ